MSREGQIDPIVLTGVRRRPVPVIDIIVEAEKYFAGTKYQKITDRAGRLLLAGDEGGAAEIIKNELPTAEMLFLDLLERLKGKAVYKTLALIEQGKNINNFQKLKGFSSLLTHICVECDKGSTEFRMLLPYVYERISELIYPVSAHREAGDRIEKKH